LRLRSKPAYNIELGPPLDSSRRQAGACHWRRPFFMAVLTIKVPRQLVATGGNGFGLIPPFPESSDLPPVATGCDR
jgi:hypothetical protein